MPAFDNSLAEYLTPGLGEEAENAISSPKTPDYRRDDENYEHEMNVLSEENDEQNPSNPLQADRDPPIYAQFRR